MRKIYIIIIISVILLSDIKAQDFTKCGFQDISTEDAQKLPWYGNEKFLPGFIDSLYQAKGLDKNVENVMFKVPVKFWIYRKSNGTPGGTYDLPTDVNYQRMMDELNNAFRNNNVPIRFYMITTIGYVDNDDYLNISALKAFQIGALHKHLRALNIHIVNTLTDAGGVAWFAPEANRNVFIPRYVYDHAPQYDYLYSTVPHEVGHYFSLLHPFQFTEWNLPCLREPVTRGFKWTLCHGLVPTYEKRCLYTGDFLCDTPSDPNMSKNGYLADNCEWVCSGLCTDYYGEYFEPDVHNIMAYGNEGCESHFSSGQKNVMTYSASVSPNSGWWLPYLVNNFDSYEPDNTANTARKINIDETQEHSFHNSDDNFLNVLDDDWVYFTVTGAYENSVIEITTSENGVFKPDTKITLYKENTGGDLQYVTHDEDSNGNGFSKIEVSNIQQGKYYVQVDVPYNGLGKYYLMVRACVPANECQSGIINSGETLHLAAINNVTLPCNGSNQFIVKSGANVILKSTNEIVLNTGFEAEEGSNFEAIITPDLSCNDNDNKNATIYTNKQPVITADESDKSYDDISEPEVIPEKNKFIIYPNPNHGIFYISLIDKNETVNSLKIISPTGNTILFDINIHENKEVNITDFPSGIYIIQIQTNNNYYTSKFIYNK